MNQSPEEKSQLLKKLRQTSTEMKAKEMGVAPSDLTQRIRDGKTEWALRSEVNQQLQKQRSLVERSQESRSIRGGQNSLSSLIQTEIQHSRMLMQELSRENLLAKEESSYRIEINKIENVNQNTAEQILMAEKKIEQIKVDHLVFTQAEPILKQFQQAKEKQSSQEFQALLDQHSDLLQEYEKRRKTLMPQIEKARHHRRELQTIFWQIIDIHFKLQHISIQSNLQRLEILLQTSGQTDQIHLQQSVAQYQNQTETLHKTFGRLASQCPPSHTALSEATHQWNTVLAQAQANLAQQSTLRQEILQLHFPSPQDTPPPQKDSRRMTYMERREKE